jgi:biotin carboxylase
MPRVLILSTTTGYQLRSFGDAAAKTGIDLMFATDRCHQLEDPWRDAAVAVRFHEEDSSLDAIMEASVLRRIDGIIAVGDRPVVLAARVAKELCVAGNPVTAAATSVNKLLTRRALARAGLNVPWFFDESARTKISRDPRVQFPCVIKPLGLSGSRGVMRANSPSELDAATRRLQALLSRVDVRAIRTGLDDVVLVEGFIDGREFAIEGVLTDGVLHPFAIFDKPDPLDGPFFEETIYVTPSALEEHVQSAVLDAVQRATAALGLTDGAVHAECRVGANGIFVLEVAARPIGGLCSKVLRFTSNDSTDASLEEVLLRHAAGEDISRFTPQARAAGVMMIPIPRKGLFKRVHGIEDAGAIDGIEDVKITAKPDQLLEPLPEAGSYLGFIFARGDSANGVVSALKASHARLQFDIATPIPVGGM